MVSRKPFGSRRRFFRLAVSYCSFECPTSEREIAFKVCLLSAFAEFLQLHECGFRCGLETLQSWRRRSGISPFWHPFIFLVALERYSFEIETLNFTSYDDRSSTVFYCSDEWKFKAAKSVLLS